MVSRQQKSRLQRLGSNNLIFIFDELMICDF